MRSLLHTPTRPYGIIIAISLVIAVFLGVNFASKAQAASQASPTGERLISIHENGQTRGIVTSEKTLRAAFKQAGVAIDPNDLIEPGLDQELVASQYDVNVYRARPMTIVDGLVRTKIISPYQTPEQIALHAGVTLQDEDISSMATAVGLTGFGAGLELRIARATPFTLVIYGERIQAYTQATSIAAMLDEKKIAIGKDDTLSAAKNASIEPGMVVELWRNGKQTITEEQDVAFAVEQIQDVDRPIGFKEVKTAGEAGKKTVSYEVIMKNGEEVSRTEIQSVTTKQPKAQVETVGAKPSFSGNFQAALAKLRSCEGGYGSWNPAGPYYGAYQFDERTWNSVSGAPYGSASPAQQDEAAWRLYQKRGWQPWPVCGSTLPDTYR